ncbi:MAG: EamA family transporter [Candidatus Nanopelagicales bacterium]|nr:EamA family transporter [Candidatus Nanopelagicales bacterium]
MRRHTNIGYALVLVGVVGFSINAGVSRIVLDNGIGAWTLAELRALGAAALLLLIVMLTGRRARLSMPRNHWPRLLLYGLVGLGLLQSFYFEAIARIPIGLAILIEFLAPLWVALWARFAQKQAVRPILWPALAITLIGLAIVAGAQFEDLDPIGLISALLAGWCFAVYFIVGERLVAEHDPFVVSFWGFAIAAAGWMAASALIAQIVPLWEIDYGQVVTTSAAVLPMAVFLLWIISFGTVVPFASETAAMRWIPATTVSVLAMLEPVGAAAIGWWWFDERLSAFQIFGAVLVLAGITMALLSRSEHPTPAVVE